MYPLRKRERTPEQKAARRQLSVLMDIPNWDKDPLKVKWRDELLSVLEPEVDERQQYFDDRLGLEEKVVTMLRAGATNLEIFDVLEKKNPKRITYLVEKHKINRTEMRRLARASAKKADGRKENGPWVN